MAKEQRQPTTKRREYAGDAVPRQKRPNDTGRTHGKNRSDTPVSEVGKGNGEPAERLSPQERFCRLIAVEEKLPLEAYLEAFSWKGAPADAKKSAYSLLAIPEIEARIADLRPPLVKGMEPSDLLSLEQHLAELYALERIALASGNVGAAIQAAVYRGKASGLYVDRIAVAHIALEDLIARSREDGSVGIKGTEVRPRVSTNGAWPSTIRNGNSKHASGRPLLSGPRGAEK